MSTCVPLHLITDPRLRMLKGKQTDKFWDIFSLLDRYGDGVFTDEDLRTYFKMSRLRFEAFANHLVNIKVLRRKEGDTGNLCRAGDFNPATLEKRASRAGETPAVGDPLLLDLAAQFNALDRKLTDFMSTGNSGFSPTNPGQTADSAPEASQQPAQDAPTSGGQPVDGDSAEVPINSIQINSSKEEIELKLIADPVAHLRASLDSRLIEIGIDPSDVPRVFENHDLDYICAGIECFDLKYWNKGSYPAKVSLKNYLFTGFGLNFQYQNFVTKRGQKAFDFFVAQIGGQAAAAQPPAEQPRRRKTERERNEEEEKKCKQQKDDYVAEMLSRMSDADRKALRKQAVNSLGPVEAKAYQEADRLNKSPGPIVQSMIDAAERRIILEGATDLDKRATA